ncbi:hypothetical protein CTM88_19220 [Photobacterium aquimaris]|jgi:hypothetical protein|uniref:Uncharacterized protein n=1 Tax=Photobacterium aquimaris TaxID=512643 RepID=A0A2T3IF35_9GAMM|nr:hypothetical protein [Photobacterium aquimaris]OBU22069.1 hypothetical protein AYY20_12825 [Photobacterium aquimaris]PSU24110.1 hypothetical protein CTM88_19220 [Photobacterium aquimaris]
MMKDAESFYMAINFLLVDSDHYVLREAGVFTFYRKNNLFVEAIKASDLLKKQIIDVVNSHFENSVVEFDNTSSCFWVTKS